MSVNHSDPTQPRIDRNRNHFWARAPYNFVPLPERIILAKDPLPHNEYSTEGFSGWIDCNLETLSPTYVRGMLSRADFTAFGNEKTDKLTRDQKDKKAGFYSNSKNLIEGRPEPSFPGSSLRGMIRQLIEVIGYGRIRWVGKSPTFTYRAVAASRDDPLATPYKDMLGPFGRNVRAGYLHRTRNGWQIVPTKLPKDVGLPINEAFIKVKEKQIGSKDIPGFLRLNSPDYHPQLHHVSFTGQPQRSRNGQSYFSVTQIGPDSAKYHYKGVLVCSGNMIESGRSGQTSPRKNHALVLEEDSNATPLLLSDQVIRDYKDGITPFQEEELGDWKGNPGALGEGNPVFYVSKGTEVIAFGHSPNFRIPARQKFNSIERAATPYDFIPTEIRDGKQPDLADAIFGWVDGEEKVKQYAGRVSIGDATFIGAQDGVWYRPNPIVPHVLSGPKPTTFQHYLSQDRRAGHDSNFKQSLAHYGTSTNETQIRGHKFYWSKGPNPQIEATGKELEHEKQLTRMVPLKPGVRFQFRIRFENLRSEELGALLWALSLPGEDGKQYCHRIGMGKPLGMGAIQITPKISLSNRLERYESLFTGKTWSEPEQPADPAKHVQAFERLVLDEIAPQTSRLVDLERIQDLLTLMEWHDSNQNWLDWTRYMEIEHEPGKVNEYKERPVLPTPRGVITLFGGKSPTLNADEVSNPQSTTGSQDRTQKIQPSQLSETRSQSPARQGQSEPRPPTIPEITPGSRIRAKVSFIDDNGDVYMEVGKNSGGISLARVRKGKLAGKKITEAAELVCLVESVTKEGDDLVAECRLPPSSSTEGYQTGVVKSFGLGATQSYGFIKPDSGGEDLFVHVSNLAAGVEVLISNQRVKFKVGKNMKGKPIALDVQLIGKD